MTGHPTLTFQQRQAPTSKQNTEEGARDNKHVGVIAQISLLSSPSYREDGLTTMMCMATSSTSEPSLSQKAPPASESPSNTHLELTLRRSAISLGDKIKGSPLALGLHRRFQTVYHRHTPEAAGMILRVKELENGPKHLVRTREEQGQERKEVQGYKVVGNRKDQFLDV